MHRIVIGIDNAVWASVVSESEIEKSWDLDDDRTPTEYAEAQITGIVKKYISHMAGQEYHRNRPRLTKSDVRITA